MVKTLVTGFTPFDGRQVNGSWIAAQSLAGEPGVDALEIPVEWGQPANLLEPFCQRDCPEIIISMGEGREGWFDIETRARNARKERPDNQGQSPGGAPIHEAGEALLSASIDAFALQRRLAADAFPVRISRDAGAFLCEETLYNLERLRGRHAQLATVTFVHLPPYGSSLHFQGRTITCDENLLLPFARALLSAVHSLHGTSGCHEETDSHIGEIVHNARL